MDTENEDTMVAEVLVSFVGLNFCEIILTSYKRWTNDASNEIRSSSGQRHVWRLSITQEYSTRITLSQHILPITIPIHESSSKSLPQVVET